MKTIITLCALSLSALLLSGCSSQTSQAEYIGIDAAKSVALEAAGVAESAATFSTAGLDKRNGVDYYAVDFTANGQQYEYDIDAVTGVIIDTQSPQSGGSDVTSSPAVVTPAAQPSPSAAPATGQGTSSVVGETAAREAALAHAGLTENQVTFIQSKLEWDDGRQIYDVEFYTTDYKEYDYEIDAASGEVISFDYDADHYTPPSSGATISAEDAKALALEQVPGASASDILEFETDYDDGRVEYEGTIYYSGMKYEFEIDGYSGTIRSWEAEPAHR